MSDDANAQAARNKSTVRAFFRALEAEDPRRVADLFAEDGVHRNPYHSGLFPEGAQGREGVYAYWAPTFGNFDGMEFVLTSLHAMQDPSWVFVRYSGKIRLKNDAGWYANDYYATFHFNSGGEIVEYVEIFNPIVAARAFGIPLDGSGRA